MLRVILVLATVVALACSQLAGDTKTVNPPGCGKPTSSRFDNRDPSKIVGGTEATKGYWNWQVSLTRNILGQFCGGSVINSQWILTAAHCTSGLSTSQYSVRLGSHLRNSEGEVVAVDQVFNHPGYSSAPTTNDVALIKLKTPIVYTPEIGPVCLVDSSVKTEDLVDETVIVTGWGRIESSGLSSNTLLQAAVKIVSDDTCSIAYGASFIGETMICAADEGKDSCQGDSGGPLVWNEDGAGVYKQVGVVSWGRGCAMPDYPGVYSRLANYYDWIVGIVANN